MKFEIYKQGDRWVVSVPAGAVAVIPFIAPFRTYDKACSYTRYWLARHREARR